MMKNKRLIAILLTIICIFAFFSCFAKDNSDSNDSSNNENVDAGSGGNKDEGNNADKSENIIFDITTDVTIVCGEGFSEERSVEIYNLLAPKAKSVIVVGAEYAEGSNEIVFGKTDREVSRKAYRALELMEAEEGYVGYCVYSDGNSVAIAFDDAVYGQSIAERAALSLFIEKYLSGTGLVLGEGVYDIEKFDPIEYQENLDRLELDKRWEELSASLKEKYGDAASDMAASLRRYQTLYTDNLVEWFANLYDPVTGGFYFSNSARNSEGYLPDLESTAQALGFLTASGITNNLSVFLPKEMQQQIVAFVRSLQSPENGHFYHPQWGKELTDKYPARLGRDLGNATRLLGYFGAIPIYDAPNGTKGENPIGVAPTAALTGKLSGSAVVAVSKVIATSDAGVESWLLNEENFRNYLKKYDEKIKTDAYWVGNEFESVATQIVARDKVLKERGEKYSLCKIAVEWFTSHLDPETGLWEPYENNEYDCVNGILKCSSAISKMGYPVPGALDLMEYSIQAIASTADPHHVCCVLNPWYALTVLSANLEEHSKTAEQDIAAFKEKHLESYPQLVDSTREKFSLFVKGVGTSSGAFSYFQKKTSNTSQGLEVALDNANEGDVNSSYICSAGVAGHIWSFIGERSIPLYTTSDGMRFLKVIESLGPIVKDKEIEAVPIDFEDAENVGELVSSGFFDTWLPNGELVVELGKTYNEASKNLRFTTNGKNDLFQLHLTKPQGIFNSVAFESDIMFEPEEESTYELLMFGSSSTVKHVNIMIKAIPGDGVYVYGTDFDKIKIADIGEWFNLRVEYGRVNNVQIVCDVIVNNRLRITGKAPYGNDTLPADTLVRIQFSAYHGAKANGSVYFDNMFLEQCNKEIETLPDVELGPTEEETGILTFDLKPYNTYINQGKISEWVPKGTLGIIDSTPYGAASKVLALTTKPKDGDLFQLNITKTSESYNAIAYETDIMLDATPNSEFEILVFGTTENRGTHVMLLTDEEGVYVYTDGLDKIKIAQQKTWFKLKIVYTKVSERRICCEIFVNGNSVAIDTTPYNIDNIPVPKDITRIQFAPYHVASADGSVYFDNMSLMQIEYTVPELPEEEIPAGPGESETGLLTFDERNLQGYINAKLIDSYTENGSLGILDGKQYGWDSNILELYTPGKGTNLLQLKVTKAAESFNAVAFETDIMFLPTAPSVYELLFFGSVSADKGSHILFSANEDGIFVHGDDLALTKIASSGEHFRLKIVYTKVDDSRVCVEVFVNGISVAISTAPLGTNVYEAKDMVRIQFSAYHAASATGGVYFDNMGLIQESYEIPELPEVDEPEPEPDPTPDPEPDPDPTPNPDPTPDPDPIVPPEPITPPDPSTDGPFDGDEDIAGKDWT